MHTLHAIFGHVKGSVTRAYRVKRGKLRLAHRDTLFLDEGGQMSLCMQALLLRFLDNGVVGDDHSQAWVDVHLIAGTNRRGGNEPTQRATRALDRVRESEAAPVTNPTVRAADWPGADVSSCQSQTRGAERAYLAPALRAHSLQVARFKAVRRNPGPGCSVGTVPAN